MNSAPSSSNVSFGLGGRVCVVTGASQGIGEACARRFAREGAKVVLADVEDTRGQALAQELGGLFVHCDVGDKAQVDTLVAQAVLTHGRIDVLVNNAGIFKAADFLDVTEADFDAVALHPFAPGISGMKAQIELARAQVQQRTAAVRQRRLELEYTFIRSPVNGVVSLRFDVLGSGKISGFQVLTDSLRDPAGEGSRALLGKIRGQPAVKWE